MQNLYLHWFWQFQTNSLKTVGFLVNDTWAKWGFEICQYAILVIFSSIFGDSNANLGLIDFKIGSYIKVNVNAGENKFEVRI